MVAGLPTRKFFVIRMNLGQVYTKPIVADYMVDLFDLPCSSRVLDPCFGGGVFIDSILDRTTFSVDAIEIDVDSFCKLQNKNRPRLNLFCGDFFNHKSNLPYDGIIMNPPYVRQEDINGLAALGVSKTKLKEVCGGLNIPTKANLYIYFIIYAVRLMRLGGQLIVIFPNSWKNTPIGKFLRDFFYEMGYIANDISVIGTPFVGDPLVEVCIIRFIKGEKGETTLTTIRIDADRITDVTQAEFTPDFNSSSLCFLTSIAKIKRGLTTFSNDVFINPPISDSTYLFDIVSSPKSIPGMNTMGCSLDKVLIIPERANLSEELHTYLETSKANIISQNKPKTLLQKIANSQIWYSLTPQSFAPIIFPYIIRYKPRFILNQGCYMARDNFYLLNSNLEKGLFVALLNNYYVFLQLELCGKSYGNGILKIQKYDVDNILIVNPMLISQTDEKRLSELGLKYTESGNEDLLDAISDILKPYYDIPDIKHLYTNRKSKRLNYE